MPRTMSPQRELEFSELLRFVDFVMTKLHEPACPVNGPLSAEVERIAKQYGRSKALEGLRQAANDTVEMLADRTDEQVHAIDRLLEENHILTLSEVRRRYSSTYRRIVKRGTIKTEAEYCLVAGLLADPAAQVSPAERAQLEGMASTYLR